MTGDEPMVPMGEVADIEMEAFGRGVAWAQGDREAALGQIAAAVARDRARDDGLAARVEALADLFARRLRSGPGEPTRADRYYGRACADALLDAGWDVTPPTKDPT